MRRRWRYRELFPAELELRAHRAAHLGPQLHDQDQEIEQVVYPAAARLTSVHDVDVWLLRIHRHVELRTRTADRLITIFVAAMALAMSLLVGSTAAPSKDMARALTFSGALFALLVTWNLIRHNRAMDRVGTLMEVRERYQRRRLDLVSGEVPHD